MTVDVSEARHHLELADDYGAPNYQPLPVVISRASGAWLEDVDGNRYLDALSGYSALNFGHAHPRLVAAATRQLEALTLAGARSTPICWRPLPGSCHADWQGDGPADEHGR